MAKNEILSSVIKAVKFHFNLTQAEIAGKTGIKETYLSDLVGGRAPLSDVYSDKLSEIFGVSREYLRTGSGEVFDSAVHQTNVNGDNINGASVTVHKVHTRDFLELLRKKDDQIDRLLCIIEKLQK